VAQLAIAVGWCYVVCNKASFTRGRARPEGTRELAEWEGKSGVTLDPEHVASVVQQ
jgi:hypothetical protein